MVLAMLGVAVWALAFAPHLAKWLRAQTGRDEDLVLNELAAGLVGAIERTQRLPGTVDWVGPVAEATGRTPAEVALVFPRFPDDTTTRRVLLVDPRLGRGLVPYAQSEQGIMSGSSEVLGSTARVLLVSSSRRGLAPPVSPGGISIDGFDALWNWNPAASGSSPPAGWPAAWQGHGASLHVARVNLADRFVRVSLSNLRYAANGIAGPWIGAREDRWFLRGTHLEIHDSSDDLVRSHVVLNPVDLSIPAADAVWYLAGPRSGIAADGIPESVLELGQPNATTLANHDSARNADPGLTLLRGGSGLGEKDERKVQRWVTFETGPRLNSHVVLVLYCAVKRFDTRRGGGLVATLFETNPTDNRREVIATAQVVRSDWDVADTGTWIVERFDFGVVKRPVTKGLRLGVMLHVPSGSAEDMWVAYGAADWLSRLEAVDVMEKGNR